MNLDSLVYGGVELNARTPGARVQLAPGYDLGGSVPDTDTIAGMLLDGEAVQGSRSSNRSISLPLAVTGTRSQVAAAIDALAKLADAPTTPLVWTRPDGTVTVIDTYRGQLEQSYNFHLTGQYVTLKMQAHPFTRARDKVTVAAGAFAPVQFETFDAAATAWTVDNGGGLQTDPSAAVQGSAALRVTIGATGTTTVKRTGITPVTYDPVTQTANVRANRAIGDQDVLVALALTTAGGRLDFPAVRLPANSDWSDLVFGHGVAAGDFATNQLTPNQASMETDATGWITPANATTSRSTLWGVRGVASLRMVAVAAGLMNVRSSTDIAVAPGQAVRAAATFRPGGPARQVQLLLNFYTAGGVFVSQAAGALTTDTAGADTLVTVAATVPATAAKVALLPQVLAAAAGEAHHFDSVSLVLDAQLPHTTDVTGYELAMTPVAASFSGGRVTLDDGRFLVEGAGSAGLYSLSQVQGSARTQCGVQVSQATAMTYLVLARWPARPPAYTPALDINSTNVVKTLLAHAYRGVFGGVVEMPTTAHPQTTVTITVDQAGLSKAYTQVIPAGRRFTELGFIACPLLDVPPNNVGAQFSISVVSPNAVKRLWLFDIEGEAMILSEGMAAVAPKRIFIDPPDLYGVPKVLGSPSGGTDRSDAVSLAPWLLGALHPWLTPGRVNQFYAVTDAAPTLAMDYYPRWYGARPA